MTIRVHRRELLHIVSRKWNLPEAIGAIARAALTLELETYPKPGLVSHADRGSHDDMDAETFRASINAIAPYFASLAEAGFAKCEMMHLRKIGLAAERAMFAATDGINTHRGAIFSLGLLCAAAGARAGDPSMHHAPLGAIVMRLWSQDILRGPVLLQSHGQIARQRYGAGGVQRQAADGFPAVYNIALKALPRNALTGADQEESRVDACFALIAKLDDTNLLHRGGPEGLAFAQAAAREFLRKGGSRNPGWLDLALSIHSRFVERRLSPGGSADLLACALFIRISERSLPKA